MALIPHYLPGSSGPFPAVLDPAGVPAGNRITAAELATGRATLGAWVRANTTGRRISLALAQSTDGGTTFPDNLRADTPWRDAPTDWTWLEFGTVHVAPGMTHAYPLIGYARWSGPAPATGEQLDITGLTVVPAATLADAWHLNTAGARIVTSAIPAGILGHIRVSDDRDWLEVRDTYPTWTDVDADNTDWDDVSQP
ncbi:MAG: hypothetical protein M0P31_13745 [Solirubrobacteraceae bacterium]|nr:hypothetical protein [Solirubrobacteraceae bacterium]